MERYNEYKDSGVQWLGEIPSHWGLRRTKYVWKETDSRSEFGSEQLLSVSQYDGVREAQSDSRSESLKGYKIVKQDELVINIMLAWLGGLGVSKHEGIVSPAYCVYKLQDAQNPRFLHYLYRTPIYLAEFARHSTGIVPSRWRMYTDDFGEVLTLLPPIEEQNAMVAYLDNATAKIDEAIAQQQKMIDLLNERKQIIINNAVTKGLNHDVPMKDSGVDWIGEIPEHWEMKRLKSIISVKDKRNTDPEALLLSVYTAIGVRPRQELEERGNKASTVINYKIVSKGDLIVNRLLAWMGAYGLSNYDGVTSPDYDVYSFHADVNRGYYETLFRNTQFKSDCYKYGHGIMMMRWRTYSDEFLSINVPIPSKQEQDMIYDYLKPQIDKIEEGISQCNKLISLLQERKQIIINDVVTGKVKVS